MPLLPIPLGDQIAAFVKASAPAPGAPVTDAALKLLWEGVMNLIYTDLKANLQILPGSLVAPPGTAGGPITGIGGPAQ
jgi:hypothetical protein